MPASVLRVQEKFGEELDAYLDHRPYRTATRLFQVTTGNADGSNAAALGIGENVLITAIDPQTGQAIPKIFDPYEDSDGNVDPNLLCTGIEPRQSRAPTDHHVVVHYSSVLDQPEMAELGSLQLHPLLRPAIPRWSKETIQRVASFDQGYQNPLDPNDPLNQAPVAVTNSAGMKFIPPPVVNEPIISLALTWNIPAPLLSLADGGARLQYLDAILSYDGGVNLDDFLLADPDMVKCSIDPPGETRYEEGVYFLPITAHFQFRTLTTTLNDYNVGQFDVVGWQHDEITPDTGYYELKNDGSGRLKKCTDMTGLGLGGPSPLDGHGHAIPVRLDQDGAIAQNAFAYRYFILHPRVVLNPILSGVIVI